MRKKGNYSEKYKPNRPYYGTLIILNKHKIPLSTLWFKREEIHEHMINSKWTRVNVARIRMRIRKWKR